MRPIPNAELAWAAGFFEGEGWVSRNANKPRPTLSVGIGQSGSTRELERFARAVGLGNVRGPYEHNGGFQTTKLRYQWGTTGKKAHTVMALLQPYLTKCSPKWLRYEELREVVV